MQGRIFRKVLEDMYIMEKALHRKSFGLKNIRFYNTMGCLIPKIKAMCFLANNIYYEKKFVYDICFSFWQELTI